MHLKRLLLLSSSVAVTTALAGVAWAETRPTQVAAAGSTPSAPIGEILVTAEKREQNLQQVPIAISAFSSKQRDIQGIQSIQDITNFTPGLTYSTQLDRTAMRGIGRLSNNLAADSGVAVYSDEFFTTSTTEAGRDSLFVDRVEVLRGPQGTLYGRNSIAGAINIISRRPTAQPYAEVRWYAGSYGFMQEEAAISGPVGENVGLRLAAYAIQQPDGYFKNLYNGGTEGGVKHEWFVEGQFQLKTENVEWWVKGFTQGWNNNAGGPGALLFTPTTGPYDKALRSPNLALIFNPGFAYSTSSGFNAQGQPLGPVPGSVTGGCGVTDNPALTDIRSFCHNTRGLIDLNKVYAVNSHFTVHLPGFDVKYVTGYNHYNYYSNQDFDTLGVDSYRVPLRPGAVCSPTFVALGICAPFTAYPSEIYFYREFNRWHSHEITLSSTNASRFQWILGGYYFDENYSNPITISADPRQTELIGQRGGLANPAAALDAVLGKPVAQPDFTLYNANYDMNTRSLAAYGQFTYRITDALKFTGGVRYTHDKKSGNEAYRLILAAAADAASLGTFTPVVDVTPVVAAGALPTAFGGVAQSARGVCSTTTRQSDGKWSRCLSDTSSAVTGTARIEWSPDRDTLGYLSYSRGYKAFAFNAGTIAQGNEASPEFADDFEIGVKKTLGGRVTIDVAGFWTNYHDAQIPIGVNTGGIVLNRFFNVPESRTAGFEYTAQWAPDDHLRLLFSYSYDHTEILSDCTLVGGVATGVCFIDAADPLAKLNGAAPVGPPVVTSTGVQQAQSVKGNPLPQAPKHKIGLNANYTFNFDPGDLTFSASYIWKDRTYASVFGQNKESAPAWNQVDLRAIWTGRRDKYELIFFVKNVFDTKGYNSAGGGAVTSFGTVATYDLTPPRLVGVEMHYKIF